MSEVPGDQERLAHELADELRKLRVEDVLINTLMHVSSIGYRRLGATADTADDRDLGQVRLAIETMRALTPVLERFLPGELVRDFNASVANLQLAYAKAASETRETAADAAAASAGNTAAEESSAEPVDAPAAAADAAAGQDASRDAAAEGQSPGRGSEGQPETPPSDVSGGQSPAEGQSPGRGSEGEPETPPSDVSRGQSPGRGEKGQ